MHERRRELNPETQAELEALMAEAWRQVVERDRLANESARIWADAYRWGGAEAAKDALRERLRVLES